MGKNYNRNFEKDMEAPVETPVVEEAPVAEVEEKPAVEETPAVVETPAPAPKKEEKPAARLVLIPCSVRLILSEAAMLMGSSSVCLLP